MTVTEFPELGEIGNKEAEQLLINFSDKLKKATLEAAQEAMHSLYCDLLPWIESDAWGNYTNKIRDYIIKSATKDSIDADDLWGRKVRDSILKDYKEELIQLMDQDLLKDIKRLEELLEYERNYNRRNY